MNWLDFYYFMIIFFTACFGDSTEQTVNCYNPQDVAQALNNLSQYVTYYPFRVSEYYKQLELFYNTDIANRSIINGDSLGNYIAFVSSYDNANTLAVKAISDTTYAYNISQTLSQCIWPSGVEYVPANKMNEAGTLPIVLVQVAAHAAGGVYFYHPKFIQNPAPSFSEQPVFGTSYDVNFGENVRFLSVVLMPDFKSDWSAPSPPDPFPTDEERIKLLLRVNQAFRNQTAENRS